MFASNLPATIFLPNQPLCMPLGGDKSNAGGE
jgi:hypothetical protein